MSLLEAVVAAGILAIVLAGLVPLVTAAMDAAALTRLDTQAADLARHRTAQLQALTHVRVTAGVIVKDVATRVDGAAPQASGGSGLAPTGLAPLLASASPYVDWLDAHANWIASGTAPPPGARYRRSWAVLAAGPEGCARLWVAVAPRDARTYPRVAQAGAVQCPWGVQAP